MASVREFLAGLIKDRGTSFAEVSREIGKNHAYLQQYYQRGSPKVLDEDTRIALAAALGCLPDDFREPGMRSVSTRAPGFADRPHLAFSAPAPASPFRQFGPVPGPAGPIAGARGERTLPVYGRAQAGDYGVALISSDDRPIDWTFMPPQLEGVEGAYATFVYGVSVSPAYEDGDIALVHPHVPVKPGKFVHIVLNDDTAFIKRFMGRKGDAYVVEQLNPAKKINIKVADVRTLFRVVGKWDG